MLKITFTSDKISGEQTFDKTPQGQKQADTLLKNIKRGNKNVKIEITHV